LNLHPRTSSALYQLSYNTPFHGDGKGSREDYLLPRAHT
jgi:hypothetical protein